LITQSMKKYIKRNNIRFPYHILKDITNGTPIIWNSYCKAFQGYEWIGSTYGPYKDFTEYDDINKIPSKDFVCRNCIRAYEKANP